MGGGLYERSDDGPFRWFMVYLHAGITFLAPTGMPPFRPTATTLSACQLLWYNSPAPTPTPAPVMADAFNSYTRHIAC